MSRFRSILLSALLMLTLILLAAPRAAQAQQGWGDTWAAEQTALIYLQTYPNRTYFDQIIADYFPNRDQLFQLWTAQAAAFSPIQVTYPILIYENGRAAYQRVVTGTFSHPFVFNGITIPPTNAPVRYVTQGILDTNGLGQIAHDYSVTDTYSLAQELGLIPLAEGQQHGQIGLEPYDASATFAPGLNPFTHFQRLAQLPTATPKPQQGSEPPPEPHPVTPITWFVGLGENATPAQQDEMNQFKQDYGDFEVSLMTPFGSGEASGSDLGSIPFAIYPSIVYSAARFEEDALVSQGNLSAYYVTVTTQPDGSQFPLVIIEQTDSENKRIRDWSSYDAITRLLTTSEIDTDEELRRLWEDLRGVLGVESPTDTCEFPITEPTFAVTFYPLPHFGGDPVASTMADENYLGVDGYFVVDGQIGVDMDHGFNMSLSDAEALTSSPLPIENCSESNQFAYLNAVAVSNSGTVGVEPPKELCIVYIPANALVPIYDQPDPNSQGIYSLDGDGDGATFPVFGAVTNGDGTWLQLQEGTYVNLKELEKAGVSPRDLAPCFGLDWHGYDFSSGSKR